MEPHIIDFGRSFIRFRTTRVNHTPRLRADAACTLTQPDGAHRRYFLTCPCVAEEMYLERGLIHEPTAEFLLVMAPQDQFLMMKRHADARHDTRGVHRCGEVMPTHDGRGATVVELDCSLAYYNRAAKIESYAQFREALLENRLICGRTTFVEEDGVEVVLEYPANTVNVAHDKEAWQVDAGPIILPLPVSKKDAKGLDVTRLDTGYLVYNRWNYAEAVLRRRTPLDSPHEDAPSTNFFSLRRSFDCRNELFVAMDKIGS
jgi:hypothetical protein